jgi:aldose sugar dehydrogenase
MRMQDAVRRSSPTLFPAIARASALVIALAAASAAALLAQGSAVMQEVHESGGHRFRLVTVADGFQNPWAIAFLPNGDLLVTERAGRLRVIRGGQLQPAAISGVPEARVGGQGGLLDVVLHPQFAKNQLVYLSYSKPSADGATNTTAIVRGKLEGDALTGVQEIFEAAAWSKGQGHFGSRLAFDRDGFLFITIGDRQVPPAGDLEAHPAQLLSNHQGKVIRLHDDGRVPKDNPFVGRADAKPEIWSYGHRSLQGLAIHPDTGDVWQSEHGPQGGDELNLIRKGLNYGWPIVGFGVNYGADKRPIHAATSRAGLESPARHWVPSIATSGLMIYSGAKYPNWKGNIFLGGMNGNGSLVRLTLKGQTVASESMMLGTTLRVRDVRQSPSGDIYLAIDDRSGKLQTPIVRFEAVQ